MIKILIIDDEPAARLGMRKALQKKAFQIDEAENGIEAIKKSSTIKPDILICDINMPRMNGLEVLKVLQKEPHTPLTIVVTAYGSERVAVNAMKAGAYDYLTKPFEIEELRLTVNKAVEKIELQKENLELRQRLQGFSFKPIIGNSQAIQHINNLIKKVAATDVTVLVTGHSGTGKELVANTIHSSSERSNGPFVTMNCAAIPKDLVESELFGNEKGAYTGATAQRKGKFDLANGGTLFLDEIADMGLETQAKILRVIEEKSFTRLGGKHVLHSDVRLISATNKDLLKEIADSNFRQDLYYRIKVVEIAMPSLSDRREDIPLLVQHFINLFSKKHKKDVREIVPAALKAMIYFQWPGNVRQLQHVIEQCVVLGDSRVIKLEDIPDEVSLQNIGRPAHYDIGAESFKIEKERAVFNIERQIIEKALTNAHGNVSQAARDLDMKRQFLQQKIKKLEIRPFHFKK
jgi:DNA-binding NtrC family response regulator